MYPYNASDDDHHLRKIMSAKKNIVQVEDSQKGAERKGKKTCFVVAPIGSEGTDIRRSTEGLLKAVLKPVLDRFDYEIVIAHEISTLGSITDQVVNNLLEAELVVADLTGLNPNVMYELAIRHCAALPVVVVANKNTKLPFDVVVERTIFYSDDMHGGVDLSRELEKIIKKIHENDKAVDNPVSRAKRAESVREKLMNKEEAGDIGNYLIEKMDKLEYLIHAIATGDEKRGAGYSQFYFRDNNSNLPNIKDITTSLGVFGINAKSISLGLAGNSPVVHLEFDNDLSEEEQRLIDKVMTDFNVEGYLIQSVND